MGSLLWETTALRLKNKNTCLPEVGFLVMLLFCPALVGHGDELACGRPYIAHVLKVLPVDRVELGTAMISMSSLLLHIAAHIHSFLESAPPKLLPCCSMGRCSTPARAWHFSERSSHVCCFTPLGDWLAFACQSHLNPTVSACLPGALGIHMFTNYK